MDQSTRELLETFVEEAEEAITYIVENNFGGLASIYRQEGEKWQTSPAIQGFLATFGKFIKSRDKNRTVCTATRRRWSTSTITTIKANRHARALV